MNTKSLTIIVGVIGIVVGLVVGMSIPKGASFGATNYNRQISFDEGIAVDNTQIVDGSGNWVGAITGTTATLSSTLSVTGDTTLSDVIVNGGVYTTTTATTTLTADLICDYSVWVLTAGASVLPSYTLTMPGTSTLHADCLDTAGDSKRLLVVNASTAASSTIFAEGVGMDFLTVSDTIATTSLAQGQQAWLTFTRAVSATTTMTLEVLSAAD